MNKNKVHVQWLASKAGGSQVQQSGGEGVLVRLQGPCVSPFVSILTRHRVTNMHQMLLVVMMKMLKVFWCVCKVLVFRLL
jgi:hypothetical protein